jgi:peptide/nickel transport system substrate-binding protein
LLKLKKALPVLCALVLLTSCSNPGSQRSSQDQIVVGMTLEPMGFYPLRALDSGSYYAQTLVYEGLVRYGPDLNVMPAIAESFDVSADGLTYTFKLRPDVKFGDGTPVTFADINESFELALSKLSPFKSDYEAISKIELIKGSTVVLHLSKRSAPLLSRLVELRILPASKIRAKDHGKNALSRDPIGSGPFRIVRWESGLELVFEPNPFYWGVKPSYKQLVWRVVPDKTLMAMALRRGELDVAALDPTSWKVIKDGAKDRIELDKFPGSRTIYLGFNTNKKPFDDRRVRQAMCLSINRDDIAKALYSGFAVVPRSDVSVGSWVYNQSAKLWPFDLSQAREKLVEAGYKIIGRNWKSTDQKLLAFRILTIRDYQDVAQIVSDDLNNLDVPSEVQIVEYATLRQRYLQKGDFEAILWSRSSGPDPECSLVWSKEGAMNYSKFANPKIEALLKEGRLSIDRNSRANVYKEIQGILANELPWVFLIQPDLLVAHSVNIGNIKQADQNLTGLPWDNPLFNAATWKRVNQN